MEYNPFSLGGKKILVTGASSGIGRATAIECSKMGATLIICGRNEERLKETFAELGGDNHIIFQGNLNDRNVIKELVNTVDELDGIVLAAGIMKTIPFKFASPENFEDMFNTNFQSPVELFRLLVKAKKMVSGSSAVFIASTGGIYGFTIGNSIYGSSKAALNSMVKYCAKELAPRIRVNAICPAMVETPLIHAGRISDEQLQKDMERYPMKRYGKPEEIAYGAIYLLSPAAAWITGKSLVIDGGIHF